MYMCIYMYLIFLLPQTPSTQQVPDAVHMHTRTKLRIHMQTQSLVADQLTKMRATPDQARLPANHSHPRQLLKCSSLSFRHLVCSPLHPNS